TIHPCQFPEDLVARVILACSDRDDVVYDPYMGAGTVAVAARDHGRHFLGAEIDPTYHAVALQRLSGFPDERSVFPNLKTLRDYVERTGEPIGRYSFAMQAGSMPTERGKARIFPEEYHLAELERRLSYEEDCFSADLRGDEQP